MRIPAYITVVFTLALLVSIQGCQQTANGTNDNSKQPSGMAAPVSPYTTNADWNNYWYGGKAELTSYYLKQSRYGEIHEGTVVNVFVTEDFSKSKQVKLDNPSAAGADKLPILKLNQSYKFNTGIYPYSVMISAFQPIDINNYPHAVKITGSMQEWCGMAYYQMNSGENGFNIESRSYFETEGDKQLNIKTIVQEDELWNLIRINPDKLPKGEMQILPGAMYLRLSHKPMEPVKANLDLRDENGIMVYVIDFPTLERQLNIRFEKTFPYKITGWDDTYAGFDGKKLTTTAVRLKDMMLDYWSAHNNYDRVLREQLGLPKDTQ
jgi:hypothetical protein